MQLNSKLMLPLVAGVLIVAGSWLFYNFSEPLGRTESIESGAIAASDVIKSAKATIAAAAPESRPYVPFASPRRPYWQDAYTANSAYAAAIELRDLRKPGSFAVSKELQILCYDFWRALSSLGDTASRSDVNAPNFGAWILARDNLRMRCAAFEKGGVSLDLLNARSDDPDGISYQKADLAWRDLFKSNVEMQASDSARVLVGQGQTSRLLNGARIQFAPFMKSLDISDEETDVMIRIVELRMTSTPEMASQDLRLHLNCIKFGQCQYSYNELPLSFSADASARVLHAADRLEAAMRSDQVVRTVFGL